MRNTGTNCVCCLCCYEGGKWWQNYFDLLREPFLELISCNMFSHSFDNRCVQILNWKVIDGNAPSASVRDMSTMAENCSINHESGKDVSNSLNHASPTHSHWNVIVLYMHRQTEVIFPSDQCCDWVMETINDQHWSSVFVFSICIPRDCQSKNVYWLENMLVSI